MDAEREEGEAEESEAEEEAVGGEAGGEEDPPSRDDGDPAADVDLDRGVALALRALAAGMDDEPAAGTVDVATVGPDGYRALGDDRRRRALVDAGLAGAS